jgi:hypothetical protein
MSFTALATAAATAYSAYQASKRQKQEISGQISANQQNFDFQREGWENDRYNYKHRHQWEVEDLRKAGLNPILSAKFGGTALPPTSAKPSAENPYKGSTANELNRHMTAKQISLVGAQIENIKADTAKKAAEAGKTGAEADIVDATKLPQKVKHWASAVSQVVGPVLSFGAVVAVAKAAASVSPHGRVAAVITALIKKGMSKSQAKIAARKILFNMVRKYK